jgi:hypothetical protein
MTAASAILICDHKLPDASQAGITVEIGGLPILFETSDPEFRAMIEGRYAGFVNSSLPPAFRFKINLLSCAYPVDSTGPKG